MKDRYDPTEIEARWQSVWHDRGSFQADLAAGPKFYVLEMFPYPSGRIHIGHVRNYAIGDVIARYWRARGYQVVHPMGWDAFGLPAENAAINRGIHPWKWTYDNMAHMRSELQRMGYSYEWERELATCHPGYYGWEQALFIKMLERGMAYRKTQLINFCPDCNTVLANEQVREGKCERCSTLVEARDLPGWYFKITDYAQELLDGLDELEGKWDRRVIAEQRAWIGRSEGVEIDFPLSEPVGDTKEIKVFTTRPDTLYGVTFMSLAAEHPLAAALARGTEREAEVQAFIHRVCAQDRADRTADHTTKEGIFTGRTCRNPLTGDEVPIFLANFVLMDYGTGAVMAVPGHDQRDFEFAKVYELPIKVVIQPADAEPLDPATMEGAHEGEGAQVNSGPIDGMPNRKGMEAIADLLEKEGVGRRTVSYRLRDWSVARQRYWGCPIPVLYCDDCGVVPEKPENLPVLLPEDVKITGKGGSPLASHPSFSSATCPKCGGPARRETDTFDTFVESSWYQHRFLCARFDDDILDRAAMSAMPVDQYIGGIEHATGHLMYTRYFHRVLRDLGYVEGNEPAARLMCQGMVCMETLRCELPDGRIRWVSPEEVDEKGIHRETGLEVKTGRSEKMSKSKLNVVAPEGMVGKYGADTVRFFVLSDSPPDADLHWSSEGVEGSHRYVTKLWQLFCRRLVPRIANVAPYAGSGEELEDDARALRRLAHQALEQITRDIERFSFNTALARIRELTDGVRQAAAKPAVPDPVLAEASHFLVHALALYVPHLAEELWAAMGGEGLLVEASWPTFDEKVTAVETITVVLQVNGKVRDRLSVAPDAPEDQVREAALASERVQAHLEGKDIKRVIYVPGKLVNVVAK